MFKPYIVGCVHKANQQMWPSANCGHVGGIVHKMEREKGKGMAKTNVYNDFPYIVHI